MFQRVSNRKHNTTLFIPEIVLQSLERNTELHEQRRIHKITFGHFRVEIYGPTLAFFPSRSLSSILLGTLAVILGWVRFANASGIGVPCFNSLNKYSYLPMLKLWRIYSGDLDKLNTCIGAIQLDNHYSQGRLAKSVDCRNS